MIRAAATGPVTKLLKAYNVPLPFSPDLDQIDWASFACVFLRREMVRDIGPMDEGYFLYFEDCEYCLRAQRAGYRIAFAPSMRAMHLEGGSGTVISDQAARKRLPPYYYQARSRFFYQAHGRTGLLAANLLWYLGRALARVRLLTGRAVPQSVEKEWRDLWIGFRAPLTPADRPGP